MSTQHIVELVICSAPFIGVSLLCYFDPVNLAATKKENQS